MRNLREPREPREPRESPAEDDSQSLLSKRQVEELRSRWSSIQAGFVDEPRRAVEGADALVGSAIKMIAEGFSAQRSQLERQWNRGEQATEDLRVALQQYRSFFSRLLSL